MLQYCPTACFSRVLAMMHSGASAPRSSRTHEGMGHMRCFSLIGQALRTGDYDYCMIMIYGVVCVYVWVYICAA